jgi:hypothetical protein
LGLKNRKNQIANYVGTDTHVSPENHHPEKTGKPARRRGRHMGLPLLSLWIPGKHALGNFFLLALSTPLQFSPPFPFQLISLYLCSTFLKHVHFI